jgi:tRNA (guanine37-N1)-methyltransferase
VHIGIVTLFPELFAPFFDCSMVGRAVSTGKVHIEFEPLRQHGLGRHLSVDDTPYGGGAGMVLRVDCVVAALEAMEARLGPAHRVLMSPQGAPFTQSTARRFSSLERVVLVCGRYEGFDERVRSWVNEECSLGDFVLCGGEVAAMAVVEACVRLLPDVLGNESSTLEESFSEVRAGQLEYPQYTRPADFRGQLVPPVLTGGHHEQIRQWRAAEAERRTRERRPDLVAKVPKGET